MYFIYYYVNLITKHFTGSSEDELDSSQGLSANLDVPIGLPIPLNNKDNYMDRIKV